MVVLRGEIITFSAQKKRKANQEEVDLTAKREFLAEKELSANLSTKEAEKLDQLTAELEALRKQKLQGTIIRSRARWAEFGEKSSKYFLNLENRNYIYYRNSDIRKSKNIRPK